MSADRGQSQQGRNRLKSVEGRPLTPDTLVGSFFHSDAKRGWQGCIVAEPGPGIYLVETFDWLIGDSRQRLVRVEDMVGWMFYDTAEWMRNAYEHEVQQEWDRERTGLDQAEDESS